MKASTGSHETSAQRSQSFFERNFSLMAGQFTPPVIEKETFPQNIVIRSGPELIRLSTKAIYSIEAAGDYMCFNCHGGKTHVVRKTMKQLQDELDPAQFVRIHRSNMVNKNSIAQVTSDINGEIIVVLNSGQSLKVSRRYKSKVTPQIRSFLYN
ncbi:MAG: LytTR family transcriptional regulator [Psychrosphaera sp.]|nr:LytTR family transcriptional regulator [Psychrosphaera sp.]